MLIPKPVKVKRKEKIKPRDLNSPFSETRNPIPMNLYAHDVSLFDFTNFSDNPIIDHPSSFGSFIRPHSDSNAAYYGDDAGNKPTSVANRKSPPKHRHDRTSPLPLGMDWSLPPLRWLILPLSLIRYRLFGCYVYGRETVWPHDHQTGWSYCVTIPSWILLPTSRAIALCYCSRYTKKMFSKKGLLKMGVMVVLIGHWALAGRVQVGIQSPEGITTTREILRRFSDFLKILSELKKIFPKKNLPPAPPKRILRVKNRTLLEERRCSLEDWMEKLLSDIDISRSVSVATFLELEAAARSSFDESQLDAVSSVSSSVPTALPKTNVYIDNASDLDNASTEISELGTPRQGKDNSVGLCTEHSTLEPNLIEPLEKSMRYGIINSNLILENIEKFSKQKMLSGGESDNPRDKITENNTDSRFLRGGRAEHFPELEHCKMEGHFQRFSTESLGSDLNSVQASDSSNLGVASLFGDGLHDMPENADACRTFDSPSSDLQFHRDSLILFLSDECHKLKRVLNTLQRRLVTAKTDMEDVISRFNQESAVRQFLTTKVKDLEGELETTRENCDENMQQAILLERERYTRMQWDMELLRKQCFEMELKLKNEQDEKAYVESEKLSMMEETKMLMQELDVARKQLADLQKHHEELEVKSKADVKLLVKEVKSLLSSQSDLKQELSHVVKEKLELERVVQKEKQRMEHANAANTKLLHECNLLWDRLQECSVNFLSEEEDRLNVNTSYPSDALDLLTTSDNRIGLLLAEAQLLAQDVENFVARLEGSHKIKDGDKRTDNELRKMLTDMFVDNARLRKQVNSVVRCAFNTYMKNDEDEETSLRKTVLSKFL
ncbi:signal recognition particle 54 kDa protein 2-like [Hibiscus syriacus]|uniref:Signal recognition particle 54 kDa protein 2-like n=1 Tax=Hibiscus syriacus TaxID=106335 RepID=A0A6A2ZYZ9_HIBSY|nr:signal recognition particle 54 kDa protein 2-like [Hibiscus syriacus]